MSTSQKETTDSTTNPSSELKAEQALGLIGLGLMQKMSRRGVSDLNWAIEEDGGKADLLALRQRLELTAMAIDTGAPLTTTEVTHLLGAKPGSERTERGGLLARRISRNVWKLAKAEENSNYWRN